MMTALQELHEAHKARQARMARAALPAKPIKKLRPGLAWLYVAPIGPQPRRTDFITAAILSLRPVEREPTYRIEHVIDAVLAETHVTPQEFRSLRRSAPFVTARMVAYYVCRMKTEASISAIGRACGNRDHTTIIHGCAKVEENMANYGPLIDAVSARLAASREIAA